jgi:hypothetical protein
MIKEGFMKKIYVKETIISLFSDTDLTEGLNYELIFTTMKTVQYAFLKSMIWRHF